MVLKNSLTLQLIFKGLMTGSSHLYLSLLSEYKQSFTAVQNILIILKIMG